MVALVDDAHGAGAELSFELVLAELLGLDRRLLGFALQPGHDEREDEDRHGAERQQGEQRPERPLQDRQRAEGLGVVDLGGDADVVLRQPGPGADDGHAAIVAVASTSTPAVAGDGRGDRLRRAAVRDRRTVGRKPAVMSPPGSRTEQFRIERASSVSGSRPSRISSSSKRLLETIRPFLSKA